MVGADIDQVMRQAAIGFEGQDGAREVEAPVGRPALGTMLTERDFITKDQLAEALDEGAETGERLGEVVVRRGWISEHDLAKLLAEQWQLGFVDRASIWFDGQALGRMTKEDAQRLEALPTSVRDGQVVVAVAEPTQQRLNALKGIMGDDAVIVVVPKSALDAGLRSDLLMGGGNADAVNTKEDAMYGEPTEWTTEEEPGLQLVGDGGGQHDTDFAHETDLAQTVAALEAVSGDASALQERVSELSGRLASISEDVATASERLAAAERARAESEAKIAELEVRLAKRTEVGESLKAQLADLSRTLDTLN